MSRTRWGGIVMVVAAVSLFGAVFGPASAGADYGPYTADPPPTPAHRVVIGVVGANGSGCPAGTAARRPGAHTALTVTFSRFFATVGGDAGPLDFRSNCQFALDVRAPRGYTYAIADIGYRGRAHLAAGASGSQNARSYFTGSSQTSEAGHNLSGPLDGVWRHRDRSHPLRFSPCGVNRNLNVNADLRVSVGRSGPKSTSWLSVDSITVYRLAWKRC